jgi:murein DD-endopeptidase MepM/ murein hydrolase activator NlpD
MRRPALTVALTLLLVAGSFGTAIAADPQSELEHIQAEIAALNDRIEAAEAQKSDAGRELAAAQARVEEVLGELSAAQSAVDEVRLSIAAEEANLADLQAQLEQLERDLAETRAEISSTQRDLEIQVVQMYMDASSSVGASMLTFDSAADLAIGLTYSSDLASNSEDLIDGFVALREEEERQQRDVDGRRVRVEDSLAALDEDRRELEADLERVRGLQAAAEEDLVAAQNILNRISSDIRAAEQHKDGLEAESARIEEEIRRLQSRGDGVNPGGGAIGWPVNGPVTSAFGYRTHPIFGTRRFHAGVDIGVGHGTPIVAAEDGVVILSGPYGGYGNTVVIDHGGGLSTLYAHQSSIAAGNGAGVSKGEVIGYVGCTGYCTGAHLHFETRVNGSPADPLGYLG